jgi:1-acyl-sn-glycerol-3-phosphate acyltransferase
MLVAACGRARRIPSMLSFLPSFLLGPIAFLLFVLNTLFWGLLLYLLLAAKLVLPLKRWRGACSRGLTAIAETWSSLNLAGIRLTQRIHWDVRGAEGLSPEESYLVSANHRSWVDIVVLQQVFNRRIPFPKFFLKRSLIWVPILGGAWWALDFPFVRRYSKSYLERHPEKRGADVEATRRACERFRHRPVTILNFLEGTRFSPLKRARQNSPFRNLLRPKAGGAATVLGALGANLKSYLDVTILYPKEKVTLWDLLSGRLRRVIVRVERHEIPQDFRGADFEGDPRLMERFKAWLQEIWTRKDDLIDRLKAEQGLAAG